MKFLESDQQRRRLLLDGFKDVVLLDVETGRCRPLLLDQLEVEDAAVGEAVQV